jgi:hypothetical protein
MEVKSIPRKNNREPASVNERLTGTVCLSRGMEPGPIHHDPEPPKGCLNPACLYLLLVVAIPPLALAGFFLYYILAPDLMSNYARFETLPGKEITVKTEVFCDLNGMYVFQGTRSSWHTYYPCGDPPDFTLNQSGQVYWLTEKSAPLEIQFIEDYRPNEEIQQLSALDHIRRVSQRYVLGLDYQYP